MGKASLIYVMGFLICFGIFSRNMDRTSLAGTENVVRDYERTQAINIARSGLDIAVHSLIADSTWSSISGLSIFEGNCSVDSAGLPDGNIQLTATASIGDATHIIRAVLSPPRTRSPLDFAAFGKSSVSMTGSGNKTDSYDSSLGPYGGANIGQQGDMGTNGTQADAITLNGSVQVQGDANTGPGGTVKTTGTAGLSGSTTDDNSVDFPAPTVPAALSALSSAGVISLSGSSTQTLASGDHRFELIKLTASSALNIWAPARIYLTGQGGKSLWTTGSGVINVLGSGRVEFYCDAEMKVTGCGVINPGPPADLWVYGTSLCDDITWAGSSSFSGVVYAPEADIALSGSGDVFGSVAGSTITVTGSGRLHRDIALSGEEVEGAAGGSGTYTLVSLWE